MYSVGVCVAGHGDCHLYTVNHEEEMPAEGLEASVPDSSSQATEALEALSLTMSSLEHAQ